MSDEGAVKQNQDPVELWLEGLEKRWQVRGRLRRNSDDPQILGYMYSTIGVLCDMFIKHAPEAEKIRARWEHDTFCWDDWGHAGRENKVFPPPVLLWLGFENRQKLWSTILQLEYEGTYSFTDAAIIIRALS